jgi:trk system potassium uptake protein TrkA
MGSSPVAVWLCRALRGKHFSIRMMVTDRPRGEELAAKLEWVNVVQCDPTDPDEFSEERIQDADIFLALTPTDEQNILVAARAKSMGVGTAMALQQRGTYLHLLKHVGIDQSFSPRVSAANEILSFLQPGPIRHLASLAMGVADIYEVQVPASATQVVGKPLKALNFPARSLVAAIQRKDGIDVPGADDTIEPGDTVIVIGRSESEPELRRLFNLRRAV